MKSLIPTVLLGLLASPAIAQSLNGADLLRELSDQTLTGFNGSLLFSEYHAPDGKVLGHNAGVPNQDSCWRVRGNAVCYYYPRLQRAGSPEGVESCWTFERAGPNGYKITPVGSSRSGIARLEPGNARAHSTNGQDWTCEALISRRDRRIPTMLPASLATRAPRFPLSATGSP